MRLGVYPRAYGEPGGQEVPELLLGVYGGGTALGDFVISVVDRSIPARTGEPEAADVSSADHKGLSPRVRGNRGRRPPLRLIVRSIPARTGEPVRRRQRYNPRGSIPGVYPRGRVYPRAYGGTPVAGIAPDREKGLSPRVRGNLQLSPGLSPRVRGTGQDAAVLPDREARDRIKRVRGNRSIPARTGEPPVWSVAIPARIVPQIVLDGLSARTGEPRVYPRAYGGTGRQYRYAFLDVGLSPRVRGNPLEQAT